MSDQQAGHTTPRRHTADDRANEKRAAEHCALCWMRCPWQCGWRDERTVQTRADSHIDFRSVLRSKHNTMSKHLLGFHRCCHHCANPPADSSSAGGMVSSVCQSALVSGNKPIVPAESRQKSHACCHTHTAEQAVRQGQLRTKLVQAYPKPSEVQKDVQQLRQGERDATMLNSLKRCSTHDNTETARQNQAGMHTKRGAAT